MIIIMIIIMTTTTTTMEHYLRPYFCVMSNNAVLSLNFESEQNTYPENDSRLFTS
jgi:type II secretory pathway component PulK